jgi:hypothetical protein
LITENLSTLKIHKLTQAQYDRELKIGNIDESALYLTPDVVLDVEVAISEDGLPSLVDATPMQVIDAIDGGADMRLYVTVSTDEIRYYHINGRGTNSFGDYVNFTHNNSIEVDMITISRNERNGTVGRFISPLVDNLLFDQSTGMLYMMGNGRIISNGVKIAEGEGNNAVLTLENTTGWSNKSIPNYSNCTISINWSSLDGGVSTGSGTVIVKVGGEPRYNANVRQGEWLLHIHDYLSLGQNLVHVTIIDAYGNSQTIPFGITMYDPEALISTKLVEKTLTGDYTNDRVTKVAAQAFSGLKLGRLSLPNVTGKLNGVFMNFTADELNLPSVEATNEQMVNWSTIGILRLPNVVKINTIGDFRANKVERVVLNRLEDFGSVNLNASYTKVVTFDFHKLKSLPNIPNSSLLSNLIIRTPDTVCTLQSVPESTTVKLYVPAALLEQYKVATNWSSMADRIFAIEDNLDFCGGE